MISYQTIVLQTWKTDVKEKNVIMNEFKLHLMINVRKLLKLKIINNYIIC
ncbi:hypothetical protein sm9_1115 [Methanobrevibacter millerae]|uniref:Uncharacterized protein n=1 Tax=Methanobrevibacter millerae TaxID=230361 RepID=A0A0U2TSP3_9EURY|nr:hypothetical protein sm9_1115 [Methanobrevibacter millerae]